ncbi:MAG TPA: pilin [Candidatus Saccharimonadales bacterium]|nr:pilin [Candidatus Saccharimonadales bacterium]
MRQARGFTLIELMIVVAIIAILSSLAITVYMDSTGKSQLSEAFTIIDGVKTDISDYYTQTGSCPAFGANNLAAGTSYSGKYVASLSIAPAASGCSITAQMRNNTVSPRLQGKTVTFIMTGTGGSVSWQCSSNADPIYLPRACQ